MTRSPLWIQGIARTGKTQHLIEQIRLYTAKFKLNHPPVPLTGSSLSNPPPLIFAATGDNRLSLTTALTTALGPGILLGTKTPLGFLRQEIKLYWPVLVEMGRFSAQFPLFLRSETEQELATQLWRDRLPELMALSSPTQAPAPDRSSSAPATSPQSQTRTVRQLLDLFTLSSSGGFPWGKSPDYANNPNPESFGHSSLAPTAWWHLARDLVEEWRQWCCDRGLLTYGLICNLYGQHLLTHPPYRQALPQRFPLIFGDDLDEYPGIMATFFQILLTGGSQGAFSFNPQGSVRLGFGADPLAFIPIQHHCQEQGQVQYLEPPTSSLAQQLGGSLIELVQSGMVSLPLPGIDPAQTPLQVIQTTTRSQLLRDTADCINQLIQSNHYQPQDIAIITPGTDAIARYALLEILHGQNIPIQPLTEQRPLVSVPLIRALLTVLAFIYPGLGRWVEREQVAEMLGVLSGDYTGVSHLDPVRSGLIADHCYCPDLDRPQLLEITAFPRWDRIGYRGTQAYDRLRIWIDQQRQQLSQGHLETFIQVLDRAIQTFLWQGDPLPYDHLAALRELLETAHHYQDVAHRLNPTPPNPSLVVQRFIVLLRQGTLTANPYPTEHLGPQPNPITLATLFQYRLNRCQHRCQFWLDVGSPHWLTRGRGLWGASLFLHHAPSQTNPAANPLQEGGGIAPDRSDRSLLTEDLRLEAVRLEQTVVDLLGRASDRIYLCHSELSLGGQDQFGPLLPLVYVGATVS
ncbi:MAG: recombinase family protein [Prochlorothrix sp.]